MEETGDRFPAARFLFSYLTNVTFSGSTCSNCLDNPKCVEILRQTGTRSTICSSILFRFTVTVYLRKKKPVQFAFLHS